MKSFMVLLLFIATTGYAQSKNVVIENYNPVETYTIFTKYGSATVIELSADEVINPNNTGIVLGYADAWKVIPKGNRIYIKPLLAKADTNMIVGTSKRIYNFNLKISEKNSVFVFKFNYPEEDQLSEEATKRSLQYAAIKAELQAKQQAEDDRRKHQERLDALEKMNPEYGSKGQYPMIAPQMAWDNGLFTFLKFPTSSSLPVFFKISVDGKESLVNSHIDRDTVVIHDVVPVLVARLGDAVIEIHNLAYKDGRFNSTGTTSNARRLTKKQEVNIHE